MDELEPLAYCYMLQPTDMYLELAKNLSETGLPKNNLHIKVKDQWLVWMTTGEVKSGNI